MAVIQDSTRPGQAEPHRTGAFFAAGETDKLVFTFDEPGTYDFICLPHESLGMVGQIIVQ